MSKNNNKERGTELFWQGKYKVGIFWSHCRLCFI